MRELEIGFKYKAVEVIDKNATHYTFMCSCTKVFSLSVTADLPSMCKRCYSDKSDGIDPILVPNKLTDKEQAMIDEYYKRNSK